MYNFIINIGCSDICHSCIGSTDNCIQCSEEGRDIENNCECKTGYYENENSIC